MGNRFLEVHPRAAGQYDRTILTASHPKLIQLNPSGGFSSATQRSAESILMPELPATNGIKVGSAFCQMKKGAENGRSFLLP